MTDIQHDKILNILSTARKNNISILLENENLKFKINTKECIDPGFLAEVRNHKMVIIDFLKNHQENFKAVKNEENKIAPYKAGINERLPLSFSQERLWFIHSLEGSLHYHMPSVVRLQGQLNRGALSAALSTIMERHEILRTVIRSEEDTTYQQVLETGDWQPGYREYGLSSGNLQELVQGIISAPFDLSRDRMLRAELVKTAPDDHLLVVVIHHIAADGWSMSVLVRELVELYAATTGRRTPALPATALQYADYAVWQRNHLQGPLLDGQLSYWKEKLSGSSPLHLPTDYVRPAIQDNRGAMVAKLLPKILCDELQQLSQQQGATLFMSLLSVFKILLYRYSGQEDICVGSPIANRTRRELESLIGFFVNTVALRSNLNDGMSYLDLLAQVKTTTLEAYSNQDAPFEKVVEVSGVKRDLSRSPLFQVMFVLQNTPEIPELNLGGLKLSQEETRQDSSKFDLTFTVKETAAGLELAAEYCSSLFSRTQIERMLGHYEQLLQSVVTDRTKSIAQLGMLTEAEKTQLLIDFNDTAAAYPTDKTVVDLFEEQAASTPGNIAVSFEGEELSYGELDESSSRLANYLRSCGVTTETLVPICMDRCTEMIIGIMGILKAGGAWVPIDPAYPQERIAYMVEDTSAKIAVATTASRHLLPQNDHLRIIDIQKEWEQIQQQPINNEQHPTSNEQQPTDNERRSTSSLAYVIYTSGSTGRPKGVMVEHGSLVNLISWHTRQFNVTAKSKCTVMLGVSFDPSAAEIFSGLLSGATLYILNNELRLEVDSLLSFYQANGITHAHIPTALVPELVNARQPEGLALQYIQTGGEQLTSIQTDQVSYTIVNQYGPTENTIASSFYILPKEICIQRPPIGIPIANAEVYIVNRLMQLQPFGVPGELYVGGKGVARGYLNNPALTRERFISHPFKKGERLYRTGDLCRWLAAGNIEYLGRIDDQVKIRGYRIEPGEIETVLQQAAGVSQCVVIARADVHGGKRLLAYVVALAGYNGKEVKEWLKSKLPQYMVPSFIMELGQLPLTPNGKIDKKALPDPDAPALQGNEYVMARNATEVQLVKIWEELLNLQQVGINDNFFELGGHSLLATRVISAVRKEMGAVLAIRELFSHPTIASLAAVLASRENREPVEAITPAERVQRMPLSFSQERLWFIHSLEGSLHYHMPSLVRLQGQLNRGALSAALSTIMERHEILRTVIRSEEDTTYQQVLETGDWQPGYREYGLSSGNLQELVQGIISAPFDLSRDRMLRAELVKTAPDDHLLVVVIHHIAADGWSMSVLVKELVELYAAATGRRTPALPATALQYADYAVWQRNHLQGPLLDGQLSYWKEKLSGSSPLHLPTDYVRPAIQDNRGAMVAKLLPKILCDELQQLSQQQGATLFMSLLSVFKILLYRYSGQEDICVGSPIANRTRRELESLIGFFVNTVALRSNLNDGMSYLDLLAQVKTTTLEAYSNQDAPFEKVVEVSGVKRDLSRSPLFQVMFVLQNTPEIPELNLGGLKLSQEETRQDSSKFDLTFTVKETAAGLELAAEYCSSLFSRTQIERMLGHYEQLLQSVVTDRTKSIAQLGMLTEAEKTQLLIDFNDTAAAYPTDKTVVDLFEEQAASTPGNIAVSFEGEELSYGELDESSSRLANYLRSCGVTTETLVPICMDRCTEMIIGIMGILKAGGAWVPIDPAYPQERIAYMVEDTSAKIAVATTASRHLLPQNDHLRIIDIQKEWEQIQQQPVNNEQRPTTNGQRPTNSLAYVIYTSGSTGRPKGVMVEHGNLANLIFHQTIRFGITASEKLLQFSNYSFDASVEQIFLALCSGAALVLVPKQIQSDPEALLSLVIKEHVTHFHATPGYLENVRPGKYKDLKRVIAGGERCSLNMAKEWSAHVDFFNEYGPTETTVTISEYLYTDGLAETALPIGRPLSNTQLYILDKEQQVVPVGVTGEIYIGGAQVTRGYLNLQALTQEKFISSPFKKGERLYRTGDLCRWLAAGNIEYLGRIDDQVKIRGYRIEPGEIETVLQQAAGVSQCVVIARADVHGGKRLLAYVVALAGYNGKEVKEWLKSKLPQYMVPSFIMELGQLPLTPNGKIDKKALPDPDAPALQGNEYVMARNATEVQLVKIWEELLNLQQVGINDNFFELGGHSLLATRVISAVRKEMGAVLAIRELFSHPTIASLAAVLASRENREPVEAITPAERVQRMPLSFSQERLWFIHSLEGSLHYHMPSLVRLQGQLNRGALSAALSTIMERHEILRTVIRSEEDTTYQQVLETGDWQPGYREYGLSSGNLQELVQGIISAPFDLSRDRMLRAELVKTAPDDHLLVVVIHHIAADGWSMSVLVKELVELYAAATGRRTPALPATALQYADYAVWQRNHLQGPLLDGQLSYWKEKLSGSSPLHLPTDYVRPAIQDNRGAMVAKLLPKILCDELQQLSQQQGATLFMSLLSVFKILLYRYSGQEDICVGSPIANRTRRELESLIGFFVNTVALRSNLNDGMSYLDLLAQVKTTTLEAYSNQDAPFEKVVEVSGVKRDLSRSPLFQVMFVLQNTPEIPELNLGGLKLSQEETRQDSSKFDLTFTVKETAAGLELAAEYCSSLFSRTQIERMLGHYEQLLQSVVTDRTKSIAQLGMLTEAEKTQLLIDFNDTAAAYPTDKTVVDLFEEQAASTPGNIAVSFEGEELSYGELDESSSRLANYLRSCGVTTETLVPICMDRCTEMIIGIMGILKAGGAWVPIDPAYPQERIAYMVEDTSAKIAVATTASRHLLPQNDHLRIIDIQKEWEQIQQQPVNNEQRPTTNGQRPTNSLAYVIYTSGSTGRPKGVMVEHGSLVNRLHWGQDYFRLATTDTVLQKTTFSFDVSVWELFWPLLVGSKLVFAKPGGQKDSNYLISLIETENITTVHFVPSMLEMFLQDVNPGNCKTLKTVICSGEALTVTQATLFNEKMSGANLYNLYGPTEAAIEVSYWQVPKKEILPIIPMGKPVANTNLYILDKSGQLVPIGVPGELYIGGVQVARGYLNKDTLTKERFIGDRFSHRQGARLYCTGDLARWMPDGNVEYLGRMDGQVKIRGYRIEPGEVENVLQQATGVNQCVVTAGEDAYGQKRLTGYVVTSENYDRQEVRTFLRSRLPGYMVPAALVELRELPLTASGKIDKKALPEADGSSLYMNRYVAPVTIAEQKLAAIWEGLLNVERAGIHDNFFELGGHSLLAVRAMAKIKEEWPDAGISLIQLFNNPSIFQLAEVIQGLIYKTCVNKHRHLLLLQEKGTESPIFIVPGSAGISDNYGEFAHAFGTGQPVYGFQMQGIYEDEQPLETIEAIAAGNIGWMKTIQPQGPYKLVGHSFGGKVVFEMIKQLEQQGGTLEMAAILDTTPQQERKTADKNIEAVIASIQYLLTGNFNINGPGLSKVFKKELMLRPMDKWWDYIKSYIESKSVTINNIESYKKIFNVMMQNINIDYTPEGPINQKILVIKAEASNVKENDRLPGWKAYAPEAEYITISGDHHSIVKGKNALLLAEKIKKINYDLAA